MLRIDELVWDEDVEEHIRRHHVTFDEVEEAVYNRRLVRKSRQYLMVLGQTYGGRYLTVILDDVAQGRWYVVTARPMTDSERRLLRRKAGARRRSP